MCVIQRSLSPTTGLLTSNEKKIFDDLSSKTTHPMYWMPLVWAGTVVARARKEGRIRDDFAVKTIIDEINRLRGLCGHLLSYDWISVPLVYTQVGGGRASLMSSQFVLIFRDIFFTSFSSLRDQKQSNKTHTTMLY